MKVFDTNILPILLYGSEIWGFHKAVDIERVQFKFCRYVLRLYSNTSNLVVTGELGRFSLKVNMFVRIIKYWLHILNMDDSRYVHHCYLYQVNMTKSFIFVWVWGGMDYARSGRRTFIFKSLQAEMS